MMHQRFLHLTVLEREKYQSRDIIHSPTHHQSGEKKFFVASKSIDRLGQERIAIKQQILRN